MKNTQRRVTLTVGAVAGGLLAAAFLPMAVAVADEYDFTPDTSSFDPTQVEGYPPLDNVVTGPENMNILDLTTNTVLGTFPIDGTDTATTIGSFTNDDWLYTDPLGSAIGQPGGPSFVLPTETQIDLANFGDGFENEWIDIPTGGTDPGASDLFITPFGDFPLFGTAFADISTAIGY